MNGLEVTSAAHDANITVVVIFAPLLTVGTVVGIAVSLFQALTQIQEQTLIQTPKILGTSYFSDRLTLHGRDFA